MKNIFHTLWFWHGLCCLTALLCCIVILWPQVFLPDAWETRIIEYAGCTLLCSMVASLLLVGITTIIALFFLRYRSAMAQLLSWGGQWALSVGIYLLLAWLADVPMPKDSVAVVAPIQTADTTPLDPSDELNGPEALFILMPQELVSSMATETVAAAPNLIRLENAHSELLESYLNSSPRWALSMDDDTFYSKPGHLVMTPAGSNTGSSIQGLVHAAFRHLVEGDTLPAGYTVVKPGAPFPTRAEDKEQVTDLAVDLGRNHYLLLAWRGTTHTETAHRALCAALTMIDAMMQPLALQPTESTLQSMLTGKRNMMSDTPNMLLCQPPAQYGAYQAELYVNPGEPGTLLLRVAEAETGKPLRLLRCPARYSANPGELFRHDIPGSCSAPGGSLLSNLPTMLPEKAPLFIIRHGEAHQFFDAVFELWFQPALPLKPRRLLLRRIYRVQSYEEPGEVSPEKSDDASDSPKSPQTAEPQPTASAAPEKS